jgi:hypothetical protein
MPITVSCPCGKKLTAPDDLAGKRAKCPACGEAVNVPDVPDPHFAPTVPPTAKVSAKPRRRWWLTRGLQRVWDSWDEPPSPPQPREPGWFVRGCLGWIAGFSAFAFFMSPIFDASREVAFNREISAARVFGPAAELIRLEREKERDASERAQTTRTAIVVLTVALAGLAASTPRKLS